MNYNSYNFGISGIGTIKEFDILRSEAEIIKPNIVVWQYCINDIDELFIKHGYSFKFEPYNDLNNI